MTDDWRRVEILKDGEWISVQKSHVSKGDIFRLFEADGERVIAPYGADCWLADTNSAPIKPDGDYMIYTHIGLKQIPTDQPEDRNERFKT